MSIWETLKIEPTQDKKQIKKAYAQQLTQFHPEEHPEAFQTIQKAYQEALLYADEGQMETVLLEDGDNWIDLEYPDDILIVNEEESDYTSFEALNAYTDYVIALCKSSDTFALTQLVNDPQFQAVGHNAYFMNQLYAHLELNALDIKLENLEALQQIYGYRIRTKGQAPLSWSQALLVSSLMIQKRFQTSSETDFYQYYHHLAKSEKWDHLVYTQYLAKNEEIYALSKTAIFQKLDNYQVDFTSGFKQLIAIANEEEFSLYNESNMLLSWFASNIFRTSSAGFVLTKNEAEELATKLKLNEVSNSELVEMAKPNLIKALEDSQKNSFRKKLAYRKLKKAHKASL